MASYFPAIRYKTGVFVPLPCAYNKYIHWLKERMILMTEEIRNTLTEEVKKLIAARKCQVFLGNSFDCR